MIRFSAALRVLLCLFICFLIVCGFVVLEPASFIGKTACLSVMATYPDGFNYYKSSEKNIYDDILVGDIFIGEKADLETESSSEIYAKPASVSIKETVIGSIIKKTLSPYSANTKYGNVYLSNSAKADINIKSLLNDSLDYSIAKNGEPQVLIYHTHGTEAFMDNEEQYYTDFDEPRTTDTEKNIVKIGEILKEKLESNGIAVIHSKTMHDHPGFSGSYSRSADTIQSILKDYPSIKVIIDVHRDSITGGKSDKVAPVVNIDGKEAAQVMLVMGSQTGSITDHPDWKENLKLAVKLQNQFESDYPMLARAMLLRSKKYNQNLSKGAFLIEIGSDANTFEQAKYSAELVGNSIVKVLENEG